LVNAAPNLQISGKVSPEVTFDKVQNIFGHNLGTDKETLRNLLLAVAMDHTSTKSSNRDQDIGIPFIVHNGAKYWVSRLADGERELEVLVNNALLLLFTKEDIPQGAETALKLLEIAADMGYWPAVYYVADSSLVSSLSRDYSQFSMVPYNISTETMKTVAKDTMNRFNHCAEIGFAPCQYRIGFWLSNSLGSLKQGTDVLRKAIQTTLADNRYNGVLDEILATAARLIVQEGHKVGLDRVILEEYRKLIPQDLLSNSQY